MKEVQTRFQPSRIALAVGLALAFGVSFQVASAASLCNLGVAGMGCGVNNSTDSTNVNTQGAAPPTNATFLQQNNSDPYSAAMHAAEIGQLPLLQNYLPSCGQGPNYVPYCGGVANAPGFVNSGNVNGYYASGITPFSNAYGGGQQGASAYYTMGQEIQIPIDTSDWVAVATATYYVYDSCNGANNSTTQEPTLYYNQSAGIYAWSGFPVTGKSVNLSASNPTCGGNTGGVGCFPAGSRVLMADGSFKRIERVREGDWILGADGKATRVVDVSVMRLGKTPMLAMDDGSLFWSANHAMWTRKEGSDEQGAQWWWSAAADIWRSEVESGNIVGLHDNSSIREGDGYEFASLRGWAPQNFHHDTSWPEDTALFQIRTQGVPMIVNGYVVGACVNQDGFDYETFSWDAERVAESAAAASILRVMASSRLHGLNASERVRDLALSL